MVPRLQLVLLLLSSAAAWNDDSDLCDFDGSGFPPEQTMENGACTVQADPRERVQCKKQLKIGKEAMKHFLKFANKDYGHFYDPPVFKDVKTFRLIANGSEPHSYNYYRAFDEDLTEVIRHSLVYYMEYDGEKVVENIPNRSLQVVSVAWTKNLSPLAFTLTLDFKKNKLRQVTVELEKSNEDQSPHPEGSGSDFGESLEQCTDRSSNLEDKKDCQEQDRFARRILRVLADFRIVFEYIYPKDLRNISTSYNLKNYSEWNIFKDAQHYFKENALNHYLHTLFVGNIVENIPHKSIKYNFSMFGEKKSIAGSLEVVFNETVDYIDIRTEIPTWMPRKSSDYDCEDEETNYNDCKKQVLALEAVLDGINAFIQGDEPEELSKLLKNIKIVWRRGQSDQYILTGWEGFKPEIKKFINRAGIEMFYLDKETDHVNEENVIVWNWIGKSKKKDVNLRVRMRYDVKAAKRGGNGIKKLLFDIL